MRCANVAVLFVLLLSAACGSQVDDVVASSVPVGGSDSVTEASACQLTIQDPGDSTQPYSTGCLCSRADSVQMMGCPRGGGESASAQIGPEGGTLSLIGQQGTGVPFSITFHPKALTSLTTITVTELEVAPPAGMVDWSPVYKIEPLGLVLKTQASIRIPFSQGNGVAAYDSRLSLFCVLARLSPPVASQETSSVSSLG